MMIKLISLIGTKINIFCGGKDLAFENFILGATGWICACANIMPRKAQQLFELGSSNKIEEARKLFLKYTHCLNVRAFTNSNSNSKNLFEQLRHACGTCRLNLT